MGEVLSEVSAHHLIFQHPFLQRHPRRNSEVGEDSEAWLILEAAEATGEPDVHTAGAAMVPGVVGDELYGDVLRSESAFGCDGGFLSLRLNQTLGDGSFLFD